MDFDGLISYPSYVYKHEKYVVSSNNAKVTSVQLLVSEQQMCEKLYIYIYIYIYIESIVNKINVINIYTNINEYYI